MEQYLATADVFKHPYSDFVDLYIQNEEGEHHLISHINKLLSSSKTRHKGLVLLTECLPNLTVDSVNENSLNWVKICTIQHHSDPFKEPKLAVLSKLLSCCSSNQDFAKKFTSDHLPKTVETCLEPSSNFNQAEAAIDCLIVILLKYPNWFNPHVKKVETVLLNYLDHSCDSVVRKCALAFFYLQQSGGGGLNRVHYVNNFTVSFHRLGETVKHLFNNIVDNVSDVEVAPDTSFPPYALSSFASATDSVEECHKTARRITNIIRYMITMLQKCFVATKIVKPKLLIDFLERSIALHVCVSSPKDISPELWHKSILLKKLQVHLLNFLRYVILFLQTSLYPFSYTITKILVDSITKTEKCSCFKVDCFYQNAHYNTFGQWCLVIKNLHVNFQTKIFHIIIKNVTPLKNKVSLNLDVSMSRGKSKKLKRKAMEDKIISSGTQQNSTYENLKTNVKSTVENNARISLVLARIMLESITVGINKDLLMKLYKTVVGAVLDIQANRNVPPYNNVECQVELYRVIAAFLEQDDASEFISIYPICEILSKGAKSINKDIWLVCQEGLNVLEKISQPVCPYLSSNITRDSNQTEGMLFSEESRRYIAEETSAGISECEEIIDDETFTNMNKSRHKTIGEDEEVEGNGDSSVCPNIVSKDKSEKIKILDVKVIKLNGSDEIDNSYVHKKFKSNEQDRGYRNIDIEKDSNCKSQDEDAIVVCDLESDKEVEFVGETIVISDKETSKLDNDVIATRKHLKSNNTDSAEVKGLETVIVEDEASNDKKSFYNDINGDDMLSSFVDEVNY